MKNLLNQAIDRLIQDQSEIDDEFFLISVYFNIKDDQITSSFVKKKIKSSLLKAFKDDDRLTNISDLAYELLEVINLEIDNWEMIPKGIGLFAKVKYDWGKRLMDRKLLKQNIEIVPLIFPAKERQSVGKTYDLIPLIRQSEISHPAIVMELNHDQGNIYHWDFQGMQLIKQVTNRYVTEGQDYIETNRAPEQYSYHGTGQDSYQKSIQDEYLWFANDIWNWLKDEQQLLEQVEYLVLFISAPFKEVVDDWKNKDLMKTYDVKFLEKTKEIKDVNRLQNEVRQLITDAQISMSRNELRNAREQYDLFVEGWNKVAQAASNHQIDTLFIRRTADKEGYIYGEGMVSSYPIKNSSLVDNLAPWLVKLVMTSGGQVVVLDTNDHLELDKEVAAKLRYR